MTNKSRLAKAHSKLVADEYLRLGWTLKHEFFADEFKDAPSYIHEPCEYLFEWCHEGEPVSIDWIEFHKKHGN